MPAIHPATRDALTSRAREMHAAGRSYREIALALGQHVGSVYKWLHPAAGPRRRGGRPRKFALGQAEAEALRALALKHASFSFALEIFPGYAQCSTATAALVREEMERAAREQRRPRWPETLRAAILPRAEEEALLRGPRAFESISFSPRKGMFYEDASGRRIPFGALDVWTMDDYSTNQPYLVQTANGPRLCRQVLAAMDVYSAGWLSVEMIGRERDAYRAEDIVRFILRTIEAQGTMPVALLLERGRWDTAAVHGVALDELGHEFKGRSWGALDELFHVEHGFSSRHKAVLESSFNMLQTVLAHSGRDIGRHRGEFETATNRALSIAAKVARWAARAPEERAEEDFTGEFGRAGFLSQDEARSAHWQAMQVMNRRARERSASEFEGRALVPDDLLATRGAARPLPEGERWRFLPIKRLATVRGGFIECECAHYGAAARFQVNGISDLHVSSGHRVLVAFDPATPALGCHVANAEPRCREGWRVGDAICHAPQAEDVPTFSLFTAREGRSAKGKANAAARTAFAGVNPHRLGMTHTQVHSGEGQSAAVRTGAPMPVPMPAPAKAAARGVTSWGITERTRNDEAPDAEALAAARRRSLEILEEA